MKERLEAAGFELIGNTRSSSERSAERNRKVARVVKASAHARNKYHEAARTLRRSSSDADNIPLEVRHEAALSLGLQLDLGIKFELELNTYSIRVRCCVSSRHRPVM